MEEPNISTYSVYELTFFFSIGIKNEASRVKNLIQIPRKHLNVNSKISIKHLFSGQFKVISNWIWGK